MTAAPLAPALMLEELKKIVPRTLTHRWYGALVFLAAFLLFFIEPMIGKALLPRFGGAAQVWAVCVVFFQAMLVTGYLASYLLRKLPTRRQELIAFSSFSALALILHDVLPRSSALENPAADGSTPYGVLLRALSYHVAIPFTYLAMCGPLLQSWAYENRKSNSPYRFYAISNAGSLLALVSYPFLAERFLSLSGQARLWSWAFFLLMAGMLFTAATMLGIPRERRIPVSSGADSSGAAARGGPLSWICLSAVPSALFLAATNHLCHDIASAPLLWMLPLIVYLVTFIFAFSGGFRFNPRIFAALSVLLLFLLGDAFIAGVNATVTTAAAYAVSVVFVGGMVCHVALAKRAPPAERLTAYYVAISVGGLLGGSSVAIAAPMFFESYTELPVLLALTAAIAVYLAVTNPESADPAVAKPPAHHRLSGKQVAVLVGLSALVYWKAVKLINAEQLDLIMQSRNFYAVSRVYEFEKANPEAARRVLLDGRIIHGAQYLAPERSLIPLTYYGEGSGAFAVFRGAFPERGRRAGLVGLGVGTLAAVSRTSDEFVFYELNPENVRIASELFRFIESAAGKVSVRVGDGRLLLEREPDSSFDLLLLDAFSGDAIPVHLLTREAFALYGRILKTEGILLIHTSNRYLDLHPVIGCLAREAGMKAVLVRDLEPRHKHLQQSMYVVMSRDVSSLSFPELTALFPRSLQVGEECQPWTDDFSDLISAARWMAARADSDPR